VPLGCSVSEATGTATWTGIVVQPGAVNSLSVSFEVIVSASDTNGQKVTNVAVFPNQGTPTCSGATCTTNGVTVVVVAKTSKPAQSTPPTPGSTTPPTPGSTTPPIPGSTTPHTGEPRSGSGLFELIVLGAGLALAALGETLRRRRIKTASR